MMKGNGVLLAMMLLPSLAKAAPSTTVVISQVYAGGGNTGASWRNDYVVLFNLGSSSVNLAGWSVQYADPFSGTWQSTPLTGSIPAGHYYLVQEGSSGA